MPLHLFACFGLTGSGVVYCVGVCSWALSAEAVSDVMSEWDEVMGEAEVVSAAISEPLTAPTATAADDKELEAEYEELDRAISAAEAQKTGAHAATASTATTATTNFAPALTTTTARDQKQSTVATPSKPKAAVVLS
jgi:hypothetical protein